MRCFNCWCFYILASIVDGLNWWLPGQGATNKHPEAMNGWLERKWPTKVSILLLTAMPETQSN